MLEYEFPVITHIDQVRNAIAGREDFREYDKGDHIVFNYVVNFEDTFPSIGKTRQQTMTKPTAPFFTGYDLNAALRRECRGLIFDKDGKLIRRPYHKFFNMGEKTETAKDNIDFARLPHVFLEKLDGSMIAPFIVNEQMLWGTKMGDTDIGQMAARFVEDNRIYHALSRGLIEDGYTPIFEFCSRKNRIVVDYPNDRLVLTAVRHMETGNYLPIEEIMRYETVFPMLETVAFYYDMDFSKMSKLIETSLEGSEGYVIRFQNKGHMVKVKGSWYLQMHKTLEHIQHEKDLIRLILSDNLDDAKPFLPGDLVTKLDDFAKNMFSHMNALASEMTWEAIEIMDKSNHSKKEFALQVHDKRDSGMYFKLFDHLMESESPEYATVYAFELIKSKVMASLATQTKVDSVRHLIGSKWTV